MSTQRPYTRHVPRPSREHALLDLGLDLAAHHTKEAAITQALVPVARVAVPAMQTTALVRRGARAVRHTWIGVQALDRVHSHTRRPIVGSTWFHTPSDRTHAIDLLTHEFAALARDIAMWHELTKDDSHNGDRTAAAQWIHVDVTPTMQEWNDFAARETHSWWTRAATSWETYEEWHERLKRLRELARAHGITLESSEPVPLPQTIWEKGQTGKGGEAAAWLGVLKITVMAGIGLTGLVTLYTVMRELRAKVETKHDQDGKP